MVNRKNKNRCRLKQTRFYRYWKREEQKKARKFYDSIPDMTYPGTYAAEMVGNDDIYHLNNKITRDVLTGNISPRPARFYYNLNTGKDDPIPQ